MDTGDAAYSFRSYLITLHGLCTAVLWIILTPAHERVELGRALTSQPRRRIAWLFPSDEQGIERADAAFLSADQAPDVATSEPDGTENGRPPTGPPTTYMQETPPSSSPI